MTSHLEYADFVPHVGTSYLISDELETPVSLELIEVTPLGSSDAAVAPDGRRQAFSLLFRAPETTSIPQRTFALRHASMGTLDIFLVPIGPGKGGALYEAVFA